MQVHNRLLVVEDDPKLREELVALLGNNGYRPRAVEAFDDVVGQVLAAGADLVLLDLGLPDTDGLDILALVLLALTLPGVDGQYVCREVRRESDVPIIVVTSRDGQMDELLSMSFGADDFVAKPYNAPVLLARIARLLQRTYGSAGRSAVLERDGVRLDCDRCVAERDGRSVELTKNELRILSLLMRNAGKVVSRQRIQEELWQTDEFVDDNTLTVNVSHLRQTLGSIGARDFVQTRRGLGYLVL